MAVKIRLRRMGNKNNPFYRVVAADSRSPVKGRFIERLGWYNPKSKESSFQIDMERIAYWRENGAEISDTVKNLITKTRNQPQEAAVLPEPEAETVEEIVVVEEAKAEAVVANVDSEDKSDS